MNIKASDFLIREMETKDIYAVVSIDEKVFPNEKWGRDSFLKNIENSFDRCFVIANEKTAEIVGFAIVRVLDTADILLIAVDTDYRRQGLGEKLLKKLIESAKLPDGSQIPVMLEVRYQNIPAVNLYKKMGFTKIGVSMGYYRNPDDDALIMRRS